LTQPDQSTENDVGGDVSGTSFQAGSIGGDVYLGTPARPRWLKGLLYLAVPVVVAAGASAVALVKVLTPDDPAEATPAAVTTVTSAETTTAPATTTRVLAPPVAGANRPAPPGSTARTSVGATVPVTTTTTSATAIVAAAAPPPVATGVRYSGTLSFGSYNLDLPAPRDVDGRNVWPLTPGRLHGDENYWLAEWLGDGTPGKAECAAELTSRATRDAENLAAGSRVCGSTPEGRIFRIEVVAVNSTTITGQVTVWD
jgi:hypothetical protein